MEKLVHTFSLLFALDVLYKSKHASLLVVPGEHLADEGVHMEASEGNELPAVAHGGKIRDEILDFVLTHLLGIPVETWREVV